MFVECEYEHDGEEEGWDEVERGLLGPSLREGSEELLVCFLGSAHLGGDVRECEETREEEQAKVSDYYTSEQCNIRLR